MKFRLTIDVELGHRVPDMLGECTDVDCRMAKVKVVGVPDSWVVLSGEWHNGTSIASNELRKRNNVLAINTAANTFFAKRIKDKVCNG